MVPSLLRRRGLPLAVATLELDDRIQVVDLDDPGVLGAERIRPSRVATRRRSVTQPQALAFYRRGVGGLRWWSTFEVLWTNVTLFDRVARRLRLLDVRPLRLDDRTVLEAAEFLGIAPG